MTVNSIKELLGARYIFTLAPIMTFIIALAIGIGLVNFIAKSQLKKKEKKR